MRIQDDDERLERGSGKAPLWTGLILTALYVLFIFQGIPELREAEIIRESDPKRPGMSLNEFGDFLAGVFVPLALIWAIMGFWLQLRQLGQNTEALKLQAEELQNAVKEFGEMADEQREANGISRKNQLEAKRARAPELTYEVEEQGSAEYPFSLRISNKGVRCKITLAPGGRKTEETRKRWSIAQSKIPTGGTRLIALPFDRSALDKGTEHGCFFKLAGYYAANPNANANDLDGYLSESFRLKLDENKNPCLAIMTGPPDDRLWKVVF